MPWVVLTPLRGRPIITYAERGGKPLGAADMCVWRVHVC